MKTDCCINNASQLSTRATPANDKITSSLEAQIRQSAVYQLLFQDNLGKLAPERLNNLDFNESRDDRVAVASAGSYAIICISLQTNNHASISLLNFYRPDAPPDAQPTVLKHWRQARSMKILNKMPHIDVMWYLHVRQARDDRQQQEALPDRCSCVTEHWWLMGVLLCYHVSDLAHLQTPTATSITS